MEFKIYKTENEIEDICISYGLCKILEDNDIEYVLKDENSMYIIYTDNFDFEELEWYEISAENIISFINSSCNKTELTNNLIALNKFMNDNLINIFDYYSSNKDIKFNKCKALGIGNVFYNLGVRASTSAKALETLEHKRFLSLLGWIYSISYCNSKDIETNVLLKPKNTNQLIRCFYFTYKDKETGEIKNLTKLRDTGINIEAQIYLRTLKEYNMLKENYSEMIFIRQTPAGNKPMANKINIVNNLSLSSDIINMFLTKFYSDVDIGIKDITAKYVLDMSNKRKFFNLIQEYSKKNKMINKIFLKEMLTLQTERIQEIFNNEVVEKLGSGLNRLLRDKKGFEIQVKLYTIKNTKNLVKAIERIIDFYNRSYDKNLLNNEELKDLINSIQNDKESEIYANAILSYAKVFIKFNKENKEKEGK